MSHRYCPARTLLLVGVIASAAFSIQVIAQNAPIEQNKISVLRSDGTLMALPLETGTVK